MIMLDKNMKGYMEKLDILMGVLGDLTDQCDGKSKTKEDVTITMSWDEAKAIKDLKDGWFEKYRIMKEFDEKHMIPW